jgi:type II secretory pathway pseudopilin PulG
MVEMLVVIGIIVLIAGMTLPMLVPILRTRTLDAAVDTVKSACNMARSTAIEQRKPINLTFLQQTDAAHGPGLVLTGYDFAGAVTSGTVSTLTDNNQNWPVDSFQNYEVMLFPMNSPGWNPSTAYSVGNFVLDRGTVYICTTPNTGFEPPNSTYWQSIPTPQIRNIQSNTSNVITIALYSWSASHPYNPGDMVWDARANSNYLCIKANTNSEPPNANWQVASSLWDTTPSPGDVYVIVATPPFANPYCIHYLGNYYSSTLLATDVRFNVLKTFSQYMGETLQYLPTGCQFTFQPAWNSSATYAVWSLVSDKGTDYYAQPSATHSGVPAGFGFEPSTNPVDPNGSPYWLPCASLPQTFANAWTYVFLPDGEVWTLTPQATDVRDMNWFLTTYTAEFTPWNSSVTYSVGNPVSDKGADYVCIATNTNNEPPNSSWKFVTGAASGPTIWGPRNLTSATIIVYATTGQVVSQ